MVPMDYIMNIDRIRARLSVTFITAEHLMIVKFEGWPDIIKRFVISKDMDAKIFIVLIFSDYLQ